MADQNPKGEPHPYIPHLYKVPAPPPSAAQAMFGHLKSAQQHSAEQAQREKEWIERRGGKAR